MKGTLATYIVTQKTNGVLTAKRTTQSRYEICSRLIGIWHYKTAKLKQTKVSGANSHRNHEKVR